MIRPVIAMLAATLVAGACSGSDGSADTTAVLPSASSTSEVPVTTGPITSTTEPAPSTTPPAPTTQSTTAPTVAPSTEATAPPTTALDDPDRLAAAGQAYLDAWAAFHEAIKDPGNPALRSKLQELWTTEGYPLVIETLDNYVAAGIAARDHPSQPSELTILSDPLPVPDEPNLVDVVVCDVSTELYYEIGTRPDGGDVLIRDESVASRSLVVLEWDGSAWRYASIKLLSEQLGQTECAA